MGMGEARQRMVEDSPNKFPKRLHVLAVDDDHVSLMVLEALLHYCNYHATMVRDPCTAICMLREGKEKFDLVISGVLMPYTDGFRILKIASAEMDLPVIILSAYEDTKTMIKGITLGACAYWVKPACAKEIRNMWQHVVRKKLSLRSRDNRSGYVDADDKAQSETAGGERVFEKRSRKYSMNEINDGDGSHENKENVSELSTRKKPRMAWTNELNDRFKEVVHQLGIDKAVPMKILAMMGVDYITRQSVASRLQKYRLHVKKDRDNARMNRTPLADASERYNSIRNEPGSFNHPPSTAIAPSNPTSLFTRINHPSAVGHSSSNLFSKNVVSAGSSLLPKVRQRSSSNDSYANLTNDTIRSDALLAPCHSGNSSSYANILRGKILETSKGNHSGNSSADRSNVGTMSSPMNRFPVQSSSRLGHQQPSVKTNPFGDTGNNRLLGNSSQAAATKFPGLGHQYGRTSLGPSWQENIPNINQLTSLATSSSVGQIPTLHRSEPRKQMAEIMSNTANMARQKTAASFDVLNNNNTSAAAQMLNGNFALGTASRTSSGLPVLQIGTSAAPTQMLNGGGADGVLVPVQENGTAHLETIADQLKYINNFLLAETDVPEGIVSVDDNMPNQDSISIYDYL